MNKLYQKLIQMGAKDSQSAEKILNQYKKTGILKWVK